MSKAAKNVWMSAQQSCLDLGIMPTEDNAQTLIKRGATSVKSGQNYAARSGIQDVSQKPYTNEFGEQEILETICDRNMEYAERFVERNMAKFQGGVHNMTLASLYIMRRQRQKLDELSKK